MRIILGSLDEELLAVSLVVLTTGCLGGERSRNTGKILQRALNVHGAGLVVDGIPGKQTRQMLKTVLAQTGESEFLSTLNERRKSFYRSCKQFPVFGKGWLNRSNEAYRFAQSLV